MKRKTILLILLLSCVQAFSQVTLTGSNNPVAGNTQPYTNCDTTGILQGNAGANQTWNYPSLTSVGSTLLSWVSSYAIPYSTQFPTSNVASTTDNTNYNFFTASPSNLIANGTGGPGLVLPYTNPELYMQYPFTFNSSFSDIFSANYTLGGTQTFKTGTINVIGDAWGTINLPFGNFTNALRVKYTLITKDSSFNIISLVIVSTITSYVWFVPGKKFPVFEIVYTSSTYNGLPLYATKNVNSNSSSTPIGIRTISSEVPDEFKLYQNYPNPFNPTTKIKFDITKSKQVKLAVYDITGKEVSILVNGILKEGKYEYDLNAGLLTSGVYIYKLSDGDLTQTRKMTLLK